MPETEKIIEAEEVIEKILKHLALWDLKVKPQRLPDGFLWN